jgi:hypothetical protein
MTLYEEGSFSHATLTTLDCTYLHSYIHSSCVIDSKPILLGGVSLVLASCQPSCRFFPCADPLALLVHYAKIIETNSFA